jgi:hypothetical protein
VLDDDKPAFVIPEEDKPKWEATKKVWKDRSLKAVSVDIFKKIVGAFAVNPESKPSPESVIIGEYGGECSQLGKQVPPTFFMVSKTT